MTSRVSLKGKLKTQTVTIGSRITLGHPAIVEIMENAGFDWLTADIEHSATTYHQAQQFVQVIEPAGCVPLVRVGENNQEGYQFLAFGLDMLFLGQSCKKATEFAKTQRSL